MSIPFYNFYYIFFRKIFLYPASLFDSENSFKFFCDIVKTVLR